MINFDKKLKYDSLDQKTIDYINSLKKNNPNDTILVEIPNTRGISSDLVKKIDPSIYIRISGGYDDELISHRENVFFDNGETGEYYTSAVIYSRNEVFRIISEIEKIESKFDSGWTELQKLVYCYIQLKSSILYDPKYKLKPSSEIRSLRGLITKQSVCAGYSLIFKEIMDRQGIKCDYVEGKAPGGGHAWNIVEIEGKKYGLDLTWDSTKYRQGEFNTYDNLARDVSLFAAKHKPLDWYPLQDYQHELSTIDKNVIHSITSKMSLQADYPSTTYKGVRNDGSMFLIAQVGSSTIDGIKYYRYYYSDIEKDGRYSKPLLLYSESNIAMLMDQKKFKQYYPAGAFDVVCNVLFSMENIQDSLDKGTFYIGKYRKSGKGNNIQLVSNYQEIDKPESITSKFNYLTKVFTRSNGNQIIIQQTVDKPFITPYGYVYRYAIFEVIKEKGKSVVKKNVVFSEMNFFEDSRKELIEKFLSRKRLDRMNPLSGGYIGYLDANGNMIYNPDLVQYFSINKNKDLDNKIKKSNYDVFKPKENDFSKNSSLLVDFKALHDYAMKYEIYFDDKEKKYLIREFQSKNIITDDEIISKAFLANIWLVSAGIHVSSKDSRSGELYAFCEEAGSVYELFFNQMMNDVKSNGTIDTVKLFQNSLNSTYKDASQIIVNLFRNPYQTKIINDLFRKFANVNTPQNKIPDALYSLEYAKSLIDGSYKESKDDNDDKTKNNSDNKKNRLDVIEEYYNSVVSKLSSLDKEIYLKLKEISKDDKLSKDALNLLDGYLHNVVINKELSSYFTGKDSEIISSFTIDDKMSDSNLLDSISSYNQKIYSINHYASNVRNYRNSLEKEKNNSNEKEKKDNNLNNRTVVKIKNIPSSLKNKLSSLSLNVKNKEVWKRFKNFIHRNKDEEEKKTGKKR